MKMDNVIDGPTLEDKIVGANLRRIRQLRKLSQSQLAASMDLTFQQVQKYEKGTNRMSASRMVQAARYFGVPITELFKGIEMVAGKEQRTDPVATFMSHPEAVKLVRDWLGLSDAQRGIMLRIAVRISREIIAL